MEILIVTNYSRNHTTNLIAAYQRGCKDVPTTLCLFRIIVISSMIFTLRHVCVSSLFCEFFHKSFLDFFWREKFFRWRHKILVLFKVLLLEKRILYYGSPVKPVCATILSVISLHPQLLNKGLCSDFEPKEMSIRNESQENVSPVRSMNSLGSEGNSLHDKSPGTEKSDDMDSIKHVTILPSK